MKNIISYDYEVWVLDENEVGENPGIYYLELLKEFSGAGISYEIVPGYNFPYLIKLRGESESIKDILVSRNYISAVEFDDDIKRYIIK